MFWFKVLLICLIGIGCISSLHSVSKGKYTKTEKPITNAIAALFLAFLALGIWLWL